MSETLVQIGSGVFAQRVECEAQPEELEFSDEEDVGSKAFSWNKADDATNIAVKTNEDPLTKKRAAQVQVFNVKDVKKPTSTSSSPGASKRYPRDTSFTPSEQLMGIEDDAAWLRRAVEEILDAEIENCDPIYAEVKPKLMTRLKQFRDKIKSKITALKDIDTALASKSKRVISNPKNKQLIAECRALENKLASAKLSLEEWVKVEAERLATISDLKKDDPDFQSHEEPNLKEAPITEDEENTSKLAVVQDSLQGSLDAAANHVQFVNAKLRSIQRLAAMGENITNKVATLCERTAFTAYTDIDKPQKVIKAMTQRLS